MKINIKEIPTKLAPFAEKFQKYFKFIFIIFVLLLFGFLIFRINQFNRSEPDQSAIDQRLKSVARPKVDQSLIDKIQQLQDQNVQVQALFKQARDNPFQE